MRHLEDRIQTACVKWWNLQYGRKYGLLAHSPNGGYRNTLEAVKFKGMGVLAGWPDLTLVVKGGVYFFELKTPKGRLSESQVKMREDITRLGYSYRVVRSVEEFITEVNAIMGGGLFSGTPQKWAETDDI